MKKQLYVMQGPPEQWDSTETLGPFASKAAAKRAIRENVNEFIDTWDEFSAGAQEDMTGDYHIVEVLEVIAPKIKVAVTFSLKTVVEKEKPELAPDDWEDYYPECSVRRPSDAFRSSSSLSGY
jgi:hypothetical protein